MMCGPTRNSSPFPIACDLLGTHLPPYIYEIPIFCTSGVRPAMLSLLNCRKIRSKQPGSSWLLLEKPGRQVHSFVPARRTRNSPVGEVGQSRTVAFRVTNFGPA